MSPPPEDKEPKKVVIVKVLSPPFRYIALHFETNSAFEINLIPEFLTAYIDNEVFDVV